VRDGGLASLSLRGAAATRQSLSAWRKIRGIASCLAMTPGLLSLRGAAATRQFDVGCAVRTAKINRAVDDGARGAPYMAFCLRARRLGERKYLYQVFNCFGGQSPPYVLISY